MTAPTHWSRWGSPEHARPLPAATRELVEAVFGRAERSAPLALCDVRVADPRIPDDALAVLRALVGEAHVHVEPEVRIRHTRGKSTPDLLRLRAGDATDAPDAVVAPGSHDEIVALLAACEQQHIAAVPFGGGTSVVGGLTARGEGRAGVVALDLRRLSGLEDLDEVSHTATLRAGTLGPEAEDLLGDKGFTLGHFPQSFEYASIGGFAATRSSGQASAGYGRFDSLVVGLTVATPRGTVEVGTSPASAAGPDLRQLFLGSEGAFGIITRVTVRVRPRPEVRTYETWRFPTFVEGATAMRHLAQSGDVPTVLRLSDEAETAISATTADSGATTAGSGCLLLAGYEGTAERVGRLRSALTSRLTDLGGSCLGEGAGQVWARARFQAPYLRDALLDAGVLVETLETATFWSRLENLYAAVRGALAASLGTEGEPAIVLCHISHVYETGASLYFTVATTQGRDPLARWDAAKSAASDAIRAHGGTITHHHAVGRDHVPWYAQEIGEVGVSVMRAVKVELDPAGILNPGVLIP